MCLQDCELLPVDWILCLEMNLVVEILGQTQIILVNAQGILMFAQNVQVPHLEFFRYLQMASSFNFFPG
jgi:hypothetical protein